MDVDENDIIENISIKSTGKVYQPCLDANGNLLLPFIISMSDNGFNIKYFRVNKYTVKQCVEMAIKEEVDKYYSEHPEIDHRLKV